MTAVDAILAGASVVIGLADIHRGANKIDRSTFTGLDLDRYARLAESGALVSHHQAIIAAQVDAIVNDAGHWTDAVEVNPWPEPKRLGIEQFAQPERPPLPDIAWRPGGWRT